MAKTPAGRLTEYQRLAQTDLFSGSKRQIPKGTTDVVMERLFPEKRSTVPIDEERRAIVYEILLMCGALDLPEPNAETQETHGQG